MLVALGKMFGILFPFVKEIFLGKPSNQRKKKTPEKNTTLKQIIIALGVVSFLCCIFLVNVLKNYYAENKKLKEQLSVSKPTINKPILPSVAASKPLDPPPPAPPYLPVTEPVILPIRHRKKQNNRDDVPKHHRIILQETPIDDELAKRKLIESLRHSDNATGQ